MRHLPVRRTADLREHADVPRAGPGDRRGRAHAEVDHRRGRADHRRRHHGGRHAARPRRGLNARGISLVFAEMKDPVRRKVDRYELTRTIDPTHFFPTIGAATKAYRDETGADWRTPPTPPTVPEGRGDHRKQRPIGPPKIFGSSRLGCRGDRSAAAGGLAIQAGGMDVPEIALSSLAHHV